MRRDGKLHGVIAEFDAPSRIVDAARRAREAGFVRMEAYTPFPIEALNEELGHHSGGALPKIVLAGGVLGGLGGYLLQYWTAVHAYPLNIGGRPFHSWPAFVPVTFECTVLGAALAAVFGMMALNGLPRPYHPVFNVAAFATASRNHFFLCIEADDPRFDLDGVQRFLRGLGPVGVYDVEE